MNSIQSALLIAIAAAGTTATTLADFIPGAPVSMTGTAGPQFPTGWGTGYGQGTHALASTTTFTDAQFGDPYNVIVTSTITSPYTVTFSVDFTAFLPGEFTTLTIDAPDLAVGGTLTLITATRGTATLNADGNGFHWQGPGSMQPQTVVFEITQSPTPGTAALLGLAAIASLRRRRC